MRQLFILVAISSIVSGALTISDKKLLVTTTSGHVQGFLDSTNDTTSPLRKWLGIPYAADTTGNNRWRPPQRVEVSKNIINATAYGPACMQGRADGGNGTSVQSENCLLINVITPNNASSLPVYLYIHGGGMDSGASSDPKIDGSYLAAQGIVFASLNYRLSLWAWPHAAEIAQAGETQNLGLLDTRAAVKWLKENVEQFGGDPHKITLGGESTGSAPEMTNFYMSAWPNDPLIRGAVMQSGDTLQPMWPLNSQLNLISSNLSCTEGPGQLDCLRTKSSEELKTALLFTGAQFQPVTDNITIFKDFVAQTKRGHTAKIPLLVGTNKDEGTLIVESEPTAYLKDISAFSKSNNLNFPYADLTALEGLYPVPSEIYPTAYNASAAIWRDAHMLCLASNLAKWRTESLRLPVWRYRFDLIANNLNSRGIRIGAFHGEDIRFVMGTWRTIILSQPFVTATPYEIAVSDLMVKAWTNFVKEPTLGPQIPGWKKYNLSDTTSLALLGNITTGALAGDHSLTDSSCSYWNTLLPIFPQYSNSRLAEIGHVNPTIPVNLVYLHCSQDAAHVELGCGFTTHGGTTPITPMSNVYLGQ